MIDHDRREHCRKLAITKHVSEHMQFLDHEQPVATTRAGYIELGHEARPVLGTIREKCIDCSGGSRHEVKLCRSTACALYPFRIGKNPWRQEPSAEQRETASAVRNRPNHTGIGGNSDVPVTQVLVTAVGRPEEVSAA